MVAAVFAAAQAANNFKQEWMQLRRSFRFNEYGKISKLNPPQGPIGKVGGLPHGGCAGDMLRGSRERSVWQTC